METVMNLTTQGLRERFGILLSTENQASDTTNYGPKDVVSDMFMFNVDSWLMHPSNLLDYGREEIRRLIKSFHHILETAGFDINASQDQWVSMKFKSMASSARWITQPLGDIPHETSLQKRLQMFYPLRKWFLSLSFVKQ